MESFRRNSILAGMNVNKLTFIKWDVKIMNPNYVNKKQISFFFLLTCCLQSQFNHRNVDTFL